MEGDERPQKMRKLSNDQREDIQNDSDAAKNASTLADTQSVNGVDAPNANNGETVTEKESEETSNTAPAGDAPPAGSVAVDSDGKPLSKNQLKKLRKKQEWEAGREERKIIRKEKVVAKRERKREAREQAKADGGDDQQTSEEKRIRHVTRPVQLPVTFILDCDFDNLMRDNERISLASQITRCYSDNKNSKFRSHLTVSSFGGHLKDRFEGLLNGVYKSWKGMRFFDEDFVETAEKAKEWMAADTNGKPFKGAFAKYANMEPAKIEELKQQGEVVYLSSESDDTLTELKPFSTYIIGGLVDKNREKGICHKRAVQRKVRTAKLPIGDYLEMSSRKVLATNHVNEIMVHWLECGDWGKAFMKVMPKRKGGKLREANASGGAGEKAEDDAAEAEEDAAEAGAEDEEALKDEVEKIAEVGTEEKTSKSSEVAAS